MSVDKYKSHVFVIPEDARDEQIANGFTNHPKVTARQIQVMPVAGGWGKVLKTFKDEYISRLEQCPKCHVVMLIDFDEKTEQRQEKFDNDIPDALSERVFVVGPRDTPEALKSSLHKGYEDIGWTLADECFSGNATLWEHEQLKHNDFARLESVLKPILFS